MNQDSIDDLLKQVESQAANAVDAVGTATATAAPENGDADAGAGAPTLMAFSTPEFKRLLAIEVPVIVQLGSRRLTVGEVMRLAVGAIIEFNKSAEEELELLANNKPIGSGHAVKVGENFGIKISHIGTIKETIRKLGGQG